jgi:hypothetical protein
MRQQGKRVPETFEEALAAIRARDEAKERKQVEQENYAAVLSVAQTRAAFPCPWDKPVPEWRPPTLEKGWSRGLQRRTCKPLLDARETELYRWFDYDTNILLYVGISFNAIVRANGHKGSPWWRRKMFFSCELFPSRAAALAAALAAEAKAIEMETPLHNREGVVHSQVREFYLALEI